MSFFKDFVFDVDHLKSVEFVSVLFVLDFDWGACGILSFQPGIESPISVLETKVFNYFFSQLNLFILIRG